MAKSGQEINSACDNAKRNVGSNQRNVWICIPAISNARLARSITPLPRAALSVSSTFVMFRVLRPHLSARNLSPGNVHASFKDVTDIKKFPRTEREVFFAIDKLYSCLPYILPGSFSSSIHRFICKPSQTTYAEFSSVTKRLSARAKLGIARITISNRIFSFIRDDPRLLNFQRATVTTKNCKAQSRRIGWHYLITFRIEVHRFPEIQSPVPITVFITVVLFADNNKSILFQTKRTDNLNSTISLVCLVDPSYQLEASDIACYYDFAATEKCLLSERTPREHSDLYFFKKGASSGVRVALGRTASSLPSTTISYYLSQSGLVYFHLLLRPDYCFYSTHCDSQNDHSFSCPSPNSYRSSLVTFDVDPHFLEWHTCWHVPSTSLSFHHNTHTSKATRKSLAYASLHNNASQVKRWPPRPMLISIDATRQNPC